VTIIWVKPNFCHRCDYNLWFLGFNSKCRWNGIICHLILIALIHGWYHYYFYNYNDIFCNCANNIYSITCTKKEPAHSTFGFYNWDVFYSMYLSLGLPCYQLWVFFANKSMKILQMEPLNKAHHLEGLPMYFNCDHCYMVDHIHMSNCPNCH
jgi:hypothetical protein